MVSSEEEVDDAFDQTLTCVASAMPSTQQGDYLEHLAQQKRMSSSSFTRGSATRRRSSMVRASRRFSSSIMFITERMEDALC